MWGKNGAVLISMLAALGGTAADLARDQVVKIVSQIQRADYEGDRAALRRLAGDLKPFVEHQKLAARVRYWRGFALWRRAINGFNDNIDPKDLQEDLQLAFDEFEAVSKTDAGSADARIGALSCVGLLAFSVGQKDSARVQDLIARGRQLRKDAEAAEPDNPRLQWVLGPMLWNIPPEQGGDKIKPWLHMKRGWMRFGRETLLRAIHWSRPGERPSC